LLVYEVHLTVLCLHCCCWSLPNLGLFPFLCFHKKILPLVEEKVWESFSDLTQDRESLSAESCVCCVHTVEGMHLVSFPWYSDKSSWAYLPIYHLNDAYLWWVYFFFSFFLSFQVGCSSSCHLKLLLLFLCGFIANFIHQLDGTIDLWDLVENCNHFLKSLRIFSQNLVTKSTLQEIVLPLAIGDVKLAGDDSKFHRS